MEGGIRIGGGIEMGVDWGKRGMGVGWGEGWRKMMEGLWGVGLVGIGGVKVGEMMGFCVIILV